MFTLFTDLSAELQGEVEDKNLAVLKLEDKVSRSDKVSRQQRTDNEHLRQELSQGKSKRGEQDEKRDELSKKLRKVQDVADNRKNYIETLKTQLSSAKVSVEQVKGYYEESKDALEGKSKELKMLQRKHHDADQIISDMKVSPAKQSSYTFAAVKQNSF